ncbi:hypothetical protein DENIS_4267 [Desulfonema ishimotonii]|uniref:SH3b domain-containing protein n=1 Tax=Desulfonema ishimotonii TaxID=45657 RepID=A0A401G256_9BACT|nr:SH3 domain-containing protein [Desulfonema ishimotonii]GBC63273.1 hypothetical protein DENIS_4267 [Desulfonema ishimotonii]
MIKKVYSLSVCLFLLTVFSGVASAERMTVNVPMANVRSGPGTNYKTLWKLERYHPLKVIKSSGDWYYFEDFEGDRGWIFKKIVNRTDSVIVTKDKCNVRSGPDTTHDIIFTVERGVPFRVIERKGEWLHIRHADGDKGWIHKMLVW